MLISNDFFTEKNRLIFMVNVKKSVLIDDSKFLFKPKIVFFKLSAIQTISIK